MGSEDGNDNLPVDKLLHEAIGEAMQAYARVETGQASIIEHLLRIDFQRAHAIFFAVQNSRSRIELIKTLLELEFKTTFRTYWASCGKFLLTLAQFRNAVAHWHPHMNIYMSKSDPEKTRVKHALGHPVVSRNFGSIEHEDFAPFMRDCMYIRQELSAISIYLENRPDTLPEKFQQPIARRNEAVLRPRRKPKPPQPARQPSRQSAAKKVSAAQRRKEALGRAQRQHK